MDQEVRSDPHQTTEQVSEQATEPSSKVLPTSEVAVNQDQEAPDEEDLASGVNIDALVKDERIEAILESEDAFCENQASEDAICMDDSEAVTLKVVKDEPNESYEGDEFEADELSDSQFNEDAFPETPASEDMLEQIKAEPSEDSEDDIPLSKTKKRGPKKKGTKKTKSKKSKTERMPYKCNMCKKGFQYRKSLESHHKKFHSKAYPCGHCDKIYAEYKLCHSHRKQLHRDAKPPYYCRKCDHSFQSIGGKVNHEWKCNETYPGQVFRPIIRPSGPVKRHPCVICKERFETVKDLLGHFRMDHQTQNEIPMKPY